MMGVATSCKQDKKYEYGFPKLMISDKGVIILAVDWGVYQGSLDRTLLRGVVVHLENLNTKYTVGYYTIDFVYNNFVDYHGSVTIESLKENV